MTTPTAVWAMALAALTAAGAAAAQEAPAATGPAWTVYAPPEEPLSCWATAAPTAQENSRDGQAVEVSRGETGLVIFFSPSAGVTGQVSYTGGYPFSADNLRVEVGGQTFEMFTGARPGGPDGDEDWAWAISPEEDARLIEAMRAGSEVVVNGQSARGTVTRDTFSLMGFSSAVDQARDRCAG